MAFIELTENSVNIDDPLTDSDCESRDPSNTDSSEL